MGKAHYHLKKMSKTNTIQEKKENRKVVFGINCTGYYSSACLVLDGEIKYAINEERLTRIKYDRSFPINAIKYCCASAGIDLDDITDIFISWHPRFYIHRPSSIYRQAMENRGLISHLALNELASLHDPGKKIDPPVTEIIHKVKTVSSSWDIHFVDHHNAHLGNAYFQSGFDDCDFFLSDGFGEVASGVVGSIKSDNINEFAWHRSPHSLGLVYSTFTEYIGFKRNSDEWKVMALSAMGDAEKYYDVIRKMIKVDGIKYEVDLSFFEFYMYYTNQYFSPKLIELFGPPLEKGDEVGPRECELVAAVQKAVEDVTFELLSNLYKKTGNKKLVLGGGFFMNSVLNGKILEKTPYEEVFIGGSPGDSGNCTGSSLYGWKYVLGKPLSMGQAKHNYFGRKYTDEEIKNELNRRKIRFTRVDKPAYEAAKLIQQKKIIGWFQGASEFGERALGNRSILANPTFSDMKDLVNSSVKYREGFRPFAPAVLKEKTCDLFEIGEGQVSYFMEKVFRFKKDWQEKVPSVTHTDGTGRLQTVEKETNPLFHELISEFYKLSTCPVVLNTSFNINGMPLVESPADAINCFYKSGLDVLIISDFMVEK